MMTVTAAGYVAQRALGSTLGLAFAGLAGGFVSSAATIGAMGARAKEDTVARGGAVAGATASTIATFVQLAIVIRLANPDLLGRVAWPLAAGGGVAALYSGYWAWRASRSSATVSAGGRAFSVKAALAFALLVGVVGLLTAFAESRFGQAAVPIAAALAGFADAHASAASAAALQAAGRASQGLALLAVLAALTTNTLTKAVLAFAAGTRAFAFQVGVGLLLALASSWGAFLLQRLG
jgi:uncharacterized membrane protein (DUF4010 family)